jgi:hypothetical protein
MSLFTFQETMARLRERHSAFMYKVGGIGLYGAHTAKNQISLWRPTKRNGGS